MDKYIPTMYKKSMVDINYNLLKERGIKCIIFDLDNTLVLVRDNLVPDNILEKVKELKKDFHICIISNGFNRRIKPLCEKLELEYTSFAMKPFTRAFDRLMNKYNYKKEEICLIGDQIMTDVRVGRKLDILTILVDPLSKRELKVTSINRFLENRILKRLKFKGLLERGKYYE